MSEEGSDIDVDSQYMQHEDYYEGGESPQQMSPDHHEQHHIDQFEQSPGQEQDLDLSFEKDVNLLTKVKAKIMFNINKERQLNEIPVIYQDISLSYIAMQYAASIKSGPGPSSQTYLKRLCEDIRNDADYKVCELISDYQQDVQINKAYQEKFFVESSFLFFEMDRDREQLLDSNNTNIGIGLAGNESSIAIVLLVTQRDLTIQEIDENPHTRQIQVRGRMLDYSVGIYGVKIYNAIGGDYKQIANALYDKIDFNRQTKEFCISLELQANWKERRWIELWTRDNPDTIIYHKPKAARDKNYNFKGLKLKMRSLFILYPDRKYIQCLQDQNQADQNRATNLENVLLDSGIKQEQLQEKPESQAEQSNPPEEEEQDEQAEQQANQQVQRDNITSNKEIKDELMQAISEAKNTYEGLYDQNRNNQAKIKQIRQKNHIYIDKTNQAGMNEHKYQNILAQVHQTRMELQQTQTRYNKMSVDLQTKLNEKQSKCNQIRTAFQDLKRQVARKATYSRSQQPIKQPKIDAWEANQAQITETLQNLRLEILRARNTLAKNQKILKKKEELAEGLHLIDFQQLKIENQTLNEKIEERNEDLHKLKKKTTTMVQILTHTRQKLVFVEKMKESLKATVNELDTSIQGHRSEINTIKENCETFRLEIQDAKQETQIVNSQELILDYKRRNQNIKKIQGEIQAMIEREKQMKTVIEMHQRKQRKTGFGK